ncbi:MAG: transcriptional activator RfaH [Pseudomonadota bacterium]|nr:transcriptional activator RfaH [Pseudomonadota bacterium]
MINWYVVYTRHGAEKLAEGHLIRQGFQTYLPLCRKTTRHARRVAHVSKPLFPRYLFVAIDVSEQRWQSINGTFGVSCLVSMGDQPQALPIGVIDELRARETGRGLIEILPEIPFKAGETVRLTGGALIDQVGLFQKLGEKDRVSVMLDMLGRKLEVQVPLQTVCAYT